MSDLPRRLRQVPSPSETVIQLCREAAARIEELEHLAAEYQWEEAAQGLLVCFLQRQPSGKQNITRRAVIHRDDCKRAPGDGQESGMDLTWNVGRATGHSLRSALTQYQAQACKVCKPNVEVN